MPYDATHHDHGDGLHEDLVKLATRRDALRIFGAGSAAVILASLGGSSALAATPTDEVPSETAGPYPGDGSNGPDVLDDSGIVRHDIRRSFGDSRTLAKGIPLQVNLTVTDTSEDYARRCRGSLSTCGTATAPASIRCTRPGSRTRTTCAGSRRPTATARLGSRRSSPAAMRVAGRTSRCTPRLPRRFPTVRSSSIALPKNACTTVYATRGYSSSLNLAKTSLSSDNVFGDDRAIHQLAAVTGSVKKGFVADLTVGV